MCVNLEEENTENGRGARTAIIMGKGAVGDNQFVVGIDEAGRGPVLGPMVYGACVCPVHLLPVLRELGVADSKVLTETRREQLLRQVQELREAGVRLYVRVLQAEEISNRMLRRQKESLNRISFQAAFQLVRQALQDVGCIHAVRCVAGPS